MPTSPKLTKQSEDRILGALEAVRGLLDEGVNPDDAVVKSASEHKIPAGHIQIMVNAVNTGLTNEHRSSAEDLFKKAEEFPLANAGTILARLYPDDVKTAAERRRESAVAVEYDRAPTELIAKPKAAEKRAYALPPLTDKKATPNERYADLPEVVARKAHAAVKSARDTVEVARRETQAAHDCAVKLVAELVDHFKRASYGAFEETRYNATALFGKRAELLLELVGGRLSKQVREKRGSYRLEPVDVNSIPYSLIRSGIEAGRTYLDKKAAYEDTLRHNVEVAETAMVPFAGGPAQGRSVMAGLCSPTEKSGGALGHLGSLLSGGFGVMGGREAIKGIGSKFPGGLGGDAGGHDEFEKLTDPAHEAEIRNIQAEALLNDLMANDDVIKGHDPNDVLDAYNEVSQLSPRAATQKAIMRHAIRTRLEGAGLDSFNLDYLAGMEGKLKTRDAPEGGHLDVLKTTGVLGGKGDKGNGSDKKSSVID